MSNQNKIDDLFNSSLTIKNNKRTLSEKLRIILPSLAALLLGLLLVYPTLEDDISSISAEITKPRDGELEKLNVEKLSLYVTDSSNAVHNFNANHIEEIDLEKKIVELKAIDAIFNNKSNTWFDIKTDIGYFYKNENVMKMPNPVDIFYSEGFEMFAFNVVGDFSKNVIYSKNKVHGNGFLGKINADGFEIDTQKEVIKFLGNVKIIKSEE